jgi:hypothetical protein
MHVLDGYRALVLMRSSVSAPYAVPYDHELAAGKALVEYSVRCKCKHNLLNFDRGFPRRNLARDELSSGRKIRAEEQVQPMSTRLHSLRQRH